MHRLRNKDLQDILNKYRANSFSQVDKGTRFERIIRAYLLTDPCRQGECLFWLLPSRLSHRTCGSGLRTQAARLGQSACAVTPECPRGKTMIWAVSAQKTWRLLPPLIPSKYFIINPCLKMRTRLSSSPPTNPLTQTRSAKKRLANVRPRNLRRSPPYNGSDRKRQGCFQLHKGA